MLVLTILQTDEFKKKFKIGDFDIVQAISCINKSTVPKAQHIFRRIWEKANARTKTVDVSTIDDEYGKV